MDLSGYVPIDGLDTDDADLLLTARIAVMCASHHAATLDRVRVARSSLE